VVIAKPCTPAILATPAAGADPVEAE
jgi:hypothetical protein